jgi:hypothetical protein
MLLIFTEFSPMADPSFEPGRPGESAVELGRIVDRGLRWLISSLVFVWAEFLLFTGLMLFFVGGFIKKCFPKNIISVQARCICVHNHTFLIREYHGGAFIASVSAAHETYVNPSEEYKCFYKIV